MKKIAFITFVLSFGFGLLAQSEQKDWRWCQKCQVMFFSGNATKGRCPASGRHNSDQSGKYMLDFSANASGGQAGWKWCQKCEGLFFGQNATKGTCAAGGRHDDANSGDYMLYSAQRPPSGDHQDGWDWCSKCEGLYYKGNGGSVCPSGGGAHRDNGGNYVVKFDPSPAGDATDNKHLSGSAAVTRSIGVSYITVDDHPEYVWGYVDVQVWEVDRDGNKTKRIKPTHGDETRIWSRSSGERIYCTPFHWEEGGGPHTGGNVKSPIWQFNLDKQKLNANRILVEVRCLLEAEHKDNDFAATGWHGMPREGYYSFRLLDANSPALSSDLELRGDEEDEGAADNGNDRKHNISEKYDIMHRYAVAGPYDSETNRWHRYRAVLAVFR